MYCTVTKLLGDWVIASKLHYEIRYNCTDRFATLQLAWDGEGKLAPIAIQSKDLVGVPWCCTCRLVSECALEGHPVFRAMYYLGR